MLLSTVGLDLETGQERLTFGMYELPTASNSRSSPWACSASPKSCATSRSPEARSVVREQDRALLADRKPTCSVSCKPILRGTGLGSFLGLLPGNGAVLAPFASYALEKKLAEDPSRFGQGAIEGVAGPESANNAGAQTAFIPLLTLGIPPNAVMALMVGAMTIHGIVPGPEILTKQPQPLLGHDRFHVDRQSDAAGHQPAAYRFVGPAAESALPAAVSRHRAVLLHRHLLGEQQRRGGRIWRRRSACSATRSSSSTSSRLRCFSATCWAG